MEKDRHSYHASRPPGPSSTKPHHEENKAAHRDGLDNDGAGGPGAQEPPAKRAKTLVRKAPSRNLHAALRTAEDQPNIAPSTQGSNARLDRLLNAVTDAAGPDDNIISARRSRQSAPAIGSHELTFPNANARKRKRVSSRTSPPPQSPAQTNPQHHYEPPSRQSMRPASPPPATQSQPDAHPPTTPTFLHLQQLPQPPTPTSATALFRPPPASPPKKSTRPPISTLYHSLRLPPESFLSLQTLAKTYMLSPLHPERRDCVGTRGAGDAEMVRLRLYRCVEAFLEGDGGVGERFFGQSAGVPGEGWDWPREREEIIRVMTPLLRRVVTNERQRVYAIDSRAKPKERAKGEVIPRGIVDENKRRFEPSTEVAVESVSSPARQKRARHSPTASKASPASLPSVQPHPVEPTVSAVASDTGLLPPQTEQHSAHDLSAIDEAEEGAENPHLDLEMTLLLHPATTTAPDRSVVRLPAYTTQSIASLIRLVEVVTSHLPSPGHPTGSDVFIVEALTVERGLVVVRDDVAWNEVLHEARTGKAAIVLAGCMKILVTVGNGNGNGQDRV